MVPVSHRIGIAVAAAAGITITLVSSAPAEAHFTEIFWRDNHGYVSSDHHNVYIRDNNCNDRLGVIQYEDPADGSRTILGDPDGCRSGTGHLPVASVSRYRVGERNHNTGAYEWSSWKNA
ncbi:hypothetical protein [Nocardia blacklockiae]|uniref:hypothetical protein n=1 Tax=Nocardia blacklockiae TaxID=480036 RepID=UPI001893516F|nr:hypothetical protein [Nocardia blacklockiae]MBF6171304.1 hypothetical protein [Nocardia blacklockiae]